MKRCLKLTALTLLLGAWLFLSGFVKAATYTGNEYAVNFWSSEMNTLEQDFARIRGDGFNAVVIVVPWRQFQPDTKTRSVNREAYDALGRLMEKAGDAGLSVMLRVGYTWDAYQAGGNVGERFRKIRTDREMREAWLDYARRVYDEASAYPNYAGGFITWEDFWNYLDETAALGNSAKEAAKKSGYAAYVMGHYDKDTITRAYGKELRTEEEIFFPGFNSPARKFVLEWNDDWLNSLLLETQEVYPDLSMEVRLDIDPVNGTDGLLVGVPHTSTFPSGRASFTSCMYAAPMGSDRGTVISAAEGISKAAGILGNLRAAAGGKPVFIDQFLFTDNTPGFEDNARIREDEVPAYITGMAPVIERAGGGYAVWTYRDYCDNIIYNGQFGGGKKDWVLTGGAAVREDGGNGRLYLPAGGSARQNLGTRNVTTKKGCRIRFTYRTDVPSRIYVQGGSFSAQVALDGEGEYYVQTGLSGMGSLQVSCLDGAVEIDDVKLYSFVTEGGLYGIDGSEGPYLDAVRALNAALPD